MKFILALTLLLVGASSLSAAVPAGKTQQLTSPDQVPQGLAKSDWSSIRAAYEAGRHAFQPVPGQDGIWQARNPGQQWLTTFDQDGFVAQPQDGGWSWGLKLQSYGFGEKQTPISGQPTVKAAGQRLSYQWDAAVQEWWVNDPRGLEHGFTIGQRPDGISDHQSQISDPLAFTLGVRGTLKPTLTADAKGLLFQDAAGTTVLNYTGLKVWDADGQVLPSRFEMSDSEPTVRLLVDERRARYPITIDPIAQQAYLKASNTGVGDVFGASVGVCGDTVVVGTYGEASNSTGVNAAVSGGSGTQADNSAPYSGAIYVFTRSGEVWSQQAYLKASNTGAGDQFGRSVAVSGDTVVVGAYGEASNSIGVNAAVSGGSGTQADNSAPYSGAAYVFTRSAGVWSQQAYLKASNTGAGDSFGSSVAVSGDTVVVGASFEDSNAIGVNGEQANNSANDSGAAYVFTRSAGVWSQQAYLKASNTGQGDEFGVSVAVAEDTLVVGAFLESSNATGVDSGVSGGSGTQSDNSASASGAAYVFTRDAGGWSQQAYLKASNSGTGDGFGVSVGVSGDTVVVGAFFEASNANGVNGDQANNSAEDSGAAYVFTRSGGVWSQHAYLKASNTGMGDGFGFSVAVSGDTVVVGAYGEDSNATGVNSTQANNSALNSGAAYAFTRSGGVWTQQAYLKASNTGVGDSFGESVAVAGGTVVVGANGEDSNAKGVGGSQASNSANSSGAAFTYTLTLPLLDLAILTQPSSQLGTLGGSATFTITANGTGTLRYQWRRNTSNLPGATTTTLKLTKLQASQQGSYDCVVTSTNGSVTSAPAELTLVPPVVITRQPVGGNYRVGVAVSLSVDAIGTGLIEFQWRKKGEFLAGATDDNLQLTADANSAGDYDVVVSDSVSSVSSAVARVVVVDPPVITHQPTGLDVQPIDEAQFSIEATGSGLTYQWRRNGVNIAIGKTATYYIANAQKAAHEGWYDCVVKNSSGIAISERVFLSVGDSLDVTVSTGDRSFVVGDTVDFVASVFSMSSDNPSYQWFRNGAAITGAKSYVLTLVNLDLTKVGVYSVLVTVGSLRATGSTLLTIADPGLLIYKLTGTSLDFKGVATDTSAFSGTLLVERYEGYSPAAMILTRKDGSYNVFEVQRRANFRASTTGLAPKAQTIFSEVSGEESTSQSLLWLQGTESLVTLSPTLKTLAPQTLKGSANSLFFNPNGGPTRTDAETVSLSAVLDAPNTTIARQKAETLEEAIERISLELLLKGYADQTVAP